MVKINSILIPGINDHHIEDVAKDMAVLGVDIFNCVPYYPCQGSTFESLGEPSSAMVNEVREKAGQYVKNMRHCKRCRADAVGLLHESTDLTLMDTLKECGQLSQEDSNKPTDVLHRPNVAVASMEGILVNQHLGEASKLLIYENKNGIVSLLEARDTPEKGGGFKRWEDLAEILGDCNTLLVNGIGDNPKDTLNKSGINILEVEGVIEDAVQAVFEGKDIRNFIRRSVTKCGAECSGGGMGCG